MHLRVKHFTQSSLCCLVEMGAIYLITNLVHRCQNSLVSLSDPYRSLLGRIPVLVPELSATMVNEVHEPTMYIDEWSAFLHPSLAMAWII